MFLAISQKPGGFLGPQFFHENQAAFETAVFHRNQAAFVPAVFFAHGGFLDRGLRGLCASRLASGITVSSGGVEG